MKTNEYKGPDTPPPITEDDFEDNTEINLDD